MLTKRQMAVAATSVALLSALGLPAHQAQAALISYNLSWTGDAGYSMTGMFGFDDQSIPATGIITKNELEFMMLSFFDPNGMLLQDFNYNFPISGEFNFNFDTATETVLQSGESDSPTGFDLGIDFSAGEMGIGFFSGEPDIGIPPGQVTLSLDNTQGPGSSTTLDQNGTVVAQRKTPEPSSVLGLLAIGTFGLGANLFRQKQK